jgi:hypothetical protein
MMRKKIEEERASQRKCKNSCYTKRKNQRDSKCGRKRKNKAKQLEGDVHEVARMLWRREKKTKNDQGEVEASILMSNLFPPSIKKYLKWVAWTSKYE